MNDRKVIYLDDVIDVLLIEKEILSRVLDDIDVVGTDREKYSWGLGLIEANIKDIEELPSAQPERKKGKWILHTEIKGFPDWICTECGGSGRDDYCFCPNCGADMRGREE